MPFLNDPSILLFVAGIVLMGAAVAGLARWRAITLQLAAVRVEETLMPALSAAGSYLNPTRAALPLDEAGPSLTCRWWTETRALGPLSEQRDDRSSQGAAA